MGQKRLPLAAKTAAAAGAKPANEPDEPEFVDAVMEEVPEVEESAVQDVGTTNDNANKTEEEDKLVVDEEEEKERLESSTADDQKQPSIKNNDEDDDTEEDEGKGKKVAKTDTEAGTVPDGHESEDNDKKDSSANEIKHEDPPSIFKTEDGGNDMLDTEVTANASADGLEDAPVKNESSQILDAPIVLEEIEDFQYATKLILLLNKPKRPFSGYNLFFKLERDRILKNAKNPALKDDTTPYIYSYEEVEGVANALKAAAKARGYSGVTIREHSDEAKMFGCGDLARLVGERWKNITAENKAIFESYAGKERDKFQRQMKQWKNRLHYFEQQEERDAPKQPAQQSQNTDNADFTNPTMEQGQEDGGQPKRKRGRPKKNKTDDLTPLPHMPVAMNRQTPRRADAASSLVALAEPNDMLNDFSGGGLSDGSNPTNMDMAGNNKLPNQPTFYEALIMEQQRRISAKRRPADDPMDTFDKGHYQVPNVAGTSHYNQHPMSNKMGNMHTMNSNSANNSANPPLTAQQRQEIVAILQQRQQLQQQQDRLRQMQQETGHHPINTNLPNNRGMDPDHHM